MFSKCSVTADSFRRFEGTGRLVWNDSVVPKLRGVVESFSLRTDGQLVVSIMGAEFNHQGSQDQDWRGAGTMNYKGPHYSFEVRDGRATLTLPRTSQGVQWFDADYRSTLIGELANEQLIYFKPGIEFEKLERMPTG